jgi:hypothetical protein
VGAVTVYLDVNAIVPLFLVDSLNERADRIVRGLHDDLIISDFSVAEFSSVVARRVRTRDLRPAEARTAFSNFDTWCARHTQIIEIKRTDTMGATSLIRRLDLSVRTPDAIHIALVQRIGSDLLTFDKAMATVARTLGVPVITG